MFASYLLVCPSRILCIFLHPGLLLWHRTYVDHINRTLFLALTTGKHLQETAGGRAALGCLHLLKVSDSPCDSLFCLLLLESSLSPHPFRNRGTSGALQLLALADLHKPLSIPPRVLLYQ